jgi:hypothetical protein
MRRIALFGALALSVVALPATALGRSTSFTAPATDFIFLSSAEAQCLGENATIFGDVHVVEDDSGFHANLLGVYAVGETTGTVYRIVGTLHEDGSLTFNIVGGGVGHRVFEHVVFTGNGGVNDARSFICK